MINLFMYHGMILYVFFKCLQHIYMFNDFEDGV